MLRDQFATTTRGLDRSSPAMRLFDKAKQFGIWNPADLDFSQDKLDWQQFAPDEHEAMLHLSSVFQAGEEAVTLDLLPLIMTIAREGRIEEEIFLTSFLWEEAKHVDFFNRVLTEVAINSGDLGRFMGESYRLLFYEALPEALQALQRDPSPAAQVRASCTYNMIVEGVLAETGYHGFFTVLDQTNTMPGIREGIYRLKQDESRHIAYGVYLISRLVSAEPALWSIAEDTMNQLLPIAMNIIFEIFERYDPMPFGLDLGEFAAYATNQFSKRLTRIERSRGASLAEVIRITDRAIDDNDA